ncbi:MAG: EAL domain-containing protein [Gallionella sp.]
MSKITLNDIVRRDVQQIAPDCSLGDAAQRMAEQHISSLLITEQQQLLGILTERDMVRLLHSHTATNTPARHVMSHPVLTAPLDMDFGAAYAWLLKAHIRHLIVVDAQNAVVGIASESDFRRHLGFDVLRQLDSLDTVMNKELPLLPADATLDQALDMMLRERSPYVIVMDKGHPIGILTERDIPGLLLKQPAGGAHHLQLHKVMRSPIPSTHYRQSVSSVATLMQQQNLYYLVVLDDDEHIIGVITLHNLLERITAALYEAQAKELESQQSEQTKDRLAMIIEASEQGYWELDLKTGAILYSDSLRKVTGQDTQHAAHNLDEWMTRIHKDDVVEVMQKFNTALYSDGLFDVEYRLPHRAGHWMWLHVRGKATQHDAAGNAVYAAGTAMDITTRKILEKQTENERYILGQLAKNALLSDFLTELAERYEALFPSMSCAISLLNAEGTHLHHAAAPNLPLAYLQAIDTVAIGNRTGSSHTAAYTGEITLTADIAHDPIWQDYQDLASQNQLAACWAIPILSTQNKVLGIFSLYSPVPRTPLLSELTAMKQAAHFVSLAIERSQTEQMLRKNEASLRTLVQTIPDLICLKNLSGGYLACNPIFERFLGVREIDLIGKTDYDFLDKAQADRLKEQDSLTLAQNALTQHEEWITFADDGHRALMQITKTPMHDQDGQLIGVLSIAHDITHERDVQASLRRSQEDLKRAQSVAETGSWTVNIETGEMECSLETDRILSRAEQQPLSLALYFSYIHPDDQAHFELAWQAALTEDRLDIEHRMVVNGKTYHVRERAQLERDTSGKPMRMLGTVQDMTLQHTTKEMMQTLSLAVEQSYNSIIITDLAGNVQYANGAFIKSAGYTLEEAVGQNPRLWQSGKTPKTTYQDMWAHLMEGKSWKGELINRRKDGSEYYESMMVSPVRQADGRVSNYLAIKEDITKLKNAEENIQQLANFDVLTGLPNRSLLNEQVGQAISLAKRTHTEFALLFLDVDHFKNINDTLGYHIGDALLMELSTRLRALLRKEDILSRLSSDEFILVLHNTDENGTAHIADKLLELVAQPCHIETHDLMITASIGIAMYPDDGISSEQLTQCANIAMYRAKQNGRNNFRFFTLEMQAHSARRLQLENALRYAVKRDGLHLNYQPQIDLKTGRVIGTEALLRWQHPELGMISPAEFIPIAEDSGQILLIGEWVLRTAVKQMKQWLDEGIPPMTMAVNLSAMQFHSPNFPDFVSHTLNEVGLAPQYLELELTESVAMNNPASAIAVMNQLNQRGIRMSIDDFGTGYSSLSYLKRFKVYKLKIDQSFVRHIHEDADDKAIVIAIINMAKSLGFQTIAEGVETADQLAFLREQGCDEVQGYYFSKPLSTQELAQFVLKHPTTRP